MRSLLFLSAAICAATASPYPSRRAPSSTAPTVKLDAATVTGVTINSTIEQFLGIPFAQPPTGKLRFSVPVAVHPYNTSFSASEYGPYCLQIPEIIPGAPATPNVTQSEDCLTINVIRPAGHENTTLPVLAWIFGGGFDEGGPAAFDGSVIVQKSIAIGSPVVYASFNHRVNGFGFLASQEITDAGVANLGLQDQRQALRWIQKYIHSFGGDPTKVTLFGVSSGAMSTALHMLLNDGNTEGLFRAAFSESGAPIPAGSYTHGQKWYDGAVEATNCTAAKDTLECLREADVGVLQAYFETTPSKLSYQALPSAWLPRVDGKYLKDDPQQLVLKGSVANIPFISGNDDDEGTLFSLYTTNITTDADFREWVQSDYFPNATTAEIDLILKLYPSDPTVGSPFDTGTNNTLYPQYKRISAFQGDVVFQAPRRFYLQHRASLQKAWSYLDKRGKAASSLGAQHGTDITSMYGTGNGTELQDYVINFAYHLNPNGPTVPAWPQYTLASPKLLTLLDGTIPITITEDTYRVAPMEGVTALGLKYPL
ncbi:alpha beta-hydrolase [Athelia psychrophila]|uniref:Carboxylic ester hydrolase n=1 Tax=Athelia psychrophila TaxID=1759441 RepID=A0A166DTG8_9AGAM|nr:alpha beta-hydrolase [Fibularhizoctonia sp. CBS 109695]